MNDKFVQFVAGLLGVLGTALAIYIWIEWNAYTMDMSVVEATLPPFLNFDIIVNFLEYMFDKWFD